MTVSRKINLVQKNQCMSIEQKPRLGISSCLLGHAVRYDGGHKNNRFIAQKLSHRFLFQAYCPEMAAGLGVPRQPIHLIDRGAEIHAVHVKDERIDVTERLQAPFKEQLPWLRDLSGYIVKKDSPSCGMERVKVYQGKMAQKRGTGLFTRALLAQFPILPVEEEGRLKDPLLCENFIQRVEIYHHWQQLEAKGLSKKTLLAFHTRYKLTLLSHSQSTYKTLGRLLSQLNTPDFDKLCADYIYQLMQALSKIASRKNHVNVLQHLQGFLKPHIDAGDKAELTHIIMQYRQGVLPLIVPVTLLNHWFRKYPHPYVEQAAYLEPKQHYRPMH